MTYIDYDAKCRCGHIRYYHDRGHCEECACRRWRGQLKPLKKVSTAEFRSRLRYTRGSGRMCWEEVLTQLGVPHTPTGKGERTMYINDWAAKAGFTVTRISLSDVMPDVTQESAYTIAAFLGAKHDGTWLVYTPGHVICVHADRTITDTVGHRSTVGRRIIGLYRVEPACAEVITAEQVTLAASPGR